MYLVAVQDIHKISRLREQDAKYMNSKNACRPKRVASITEDDQDDQNEGPDTQLQEKDDSAATALLSLGSGIPRQPDLGALLPRRVIVRLSLFLNFLNP